MRRWRSKEFFVYIAGFARPALRRAKGDYCMKTWKHCTFAVFFAIISIGFAFIACDSNDGNTTEKEDRKDFSDPVTITGLFDNQASAKVEGRNLTDSEWAGAAETIKGALNTHFGGLSQTSAMRNTYKFVFGHVNGVTIIVENTKEYEKYSTTRGQIGAMHINSALLKDSKTLGEALRDATRVMDGSLGVPEKY
jgi:hypothetical protein